MKYIVDFLSVSGESRVRANIKVQEICFSKGIRWYDGSDKPTNVLVDEIIIEDDKLLLVTENSNLENIRWDMFITKYSPTTVIKVVHDIKGNYILFEESK